MMSIDNVFMQEAIKQAKQARDEDEVPVGAVVIHQNQIIAKAHNQVERLKDPTAHAEILAITQAANFLSAKWLHQCTMYVTIEPCSMCAGALVLSRLERLCIGAKDKKAGACGSVFNITQNDQLNHRINVQYGYFQEECASLMSQFFKLKRS